jgi:O-acetylhomoserine/O-acetylserine sulfhydrylase-like pyridoxal-dependent enzyme
VTLPIAGLSTGIEDPKDIIADIAQALDGV